MAVTTIQLDSSTREQLKAVGRKGETYDRILRRLLATSEYSDFMEEQYRVLAAESRWTRLRKPA